MPAESIEIIIPARDMAGHLQKALPPLVSQLKDGDVVTVADDASSDETAAVARQLGANVISIAKSRGPYFARHVAAEKSHADVLLFVDARCRALPGLLDAHRELLSREGVALSCTDVRTLSGPSLAARVSALQQQLSLKGKVDVPGRLPWFATANLGLKRFAYQQIGGFRAMRSGADVDICWRVQREGLGELAVDHRVLMDWEPRSSMRELLSQWKRYGQATPYIEWVYGDMSPTSFDSDDGPVVRVWKRLTQWERAPGPRGTIVEQGAKTFVSAVSFAAYLSAKRKNEQYEMPVLYGPLSEEPSA